MLTHALEALAGIYWPDRPRASDVRIPRRAWSAIAETARRRVARAPGLVLQLEIDRLAPLWCQAAPWPLAASLRVWSSLHGGPFVSDRKSSLGPRRWRRGPDQG
jgi:hypothetical protein